MSALSDDMQKTIKWLSLAPGRTVPQHKLLEWSQQVERLEIRLAARTAPQQGALALQGGASARHYAEPPQHKMRRTKT